jgi:hypothetical protein
MTTVQQSRLQGIVLIVLGILFLALNMSTIRLREIWPVFFVLLGLYFVLLFISDRKNYGVLMPASVFIVMGGLFLYCTIEGWYAMGMLWPFFLIGPGLGFFLMYFFGKKEQGLLVPGYILTGLGVLFLFIFAEGMYLWPLLLIALGIFMLVRRGSGSTPAPPASS